MNTWKFLIFAALSLLTAGCEPTGTEEIKTYQVSEIINSPHLEKIILLEGNFQNVRGRWIVTDTNGNCISLSRTTVLDKLVTPGSSMKAVFEGYVYLDDIPSNRLSYGTCGGNSNLYFFLHEINVK